MKVFYSLVIACLLFGQLLFWWWPTPPTENEPEQFKRLAVQLQDQTIIPLSACLSGKTLVTFLSTDCPICQAELTWLEKVDPKWQQNMVLIFKGSWADIQALRPQAPQLFAQALILRLDPQNEQGPNKFPTSQLWVDQNLVWQQPGDLNPDTIPTLFTQSNLNPQISN